MTVLLFRNYNSEEATYGVDAMEETHRSMIGELKKKGKDLICPSPTLKASAGQHSVFSVLDHKGTGSLNNWLVFGIYKKWVVCLLSHYRN